MSKMSSFALTIIVLLTPSPSTRIKSLKSYTFKNKRPIMQSSHVSMQLPSDTLHRSRVLYLIRHGQAVHNVREKEAMEKARNECIANEIPKVETEKIVDKARQSVLHDTSLFDAELTDLGREQAHTTGEILRKIIDDDENHGHIPKPTEAMVSPLSRCLETAGIVLKHINVEDDDHFTRALIVPDLCERKTLYPPDTYKSVKSLLRYSNDKFGSTNAFTVDEESLRDRYMEDSQCVEIETKTMLRERASKLFDLIINTKSDTHILFVSHKGYLREFERGLLGIADSPLFDNAELRVYHVTFTRGDRVLDSVERMY